MNQHSNRALARARARRRSGGAAMFVVAVTLGLLAAMGVYGLSATAADVRAAGHEREAAQAQHAAELAIVEAASALGPGTASLVVRTMQASSSFAARATSCKSAKPISGTEALAATYRESEACMVLSPSEMQKLSPVSTWMSADGVVLPFSNKSFGDVPVAPTMRVELTNPIDWSTPAGFQVGGGNGVQPPIFTQIRATVYLELRPSDAVVPPTKPATVIATGRGRLVVGPYTP